MFSRAIITPATHCLPLWPDWHLLPHELRPPLQLLSGIVFLSTTYRLPTKTWSHNSPKPCKRLLPLPPHSSPPLCPRKAASCWRKKQILHNLGQIFQSLQTRCIGRWKPMRHHRGAVFRTVRGPHRDGGDNAKKTGRDGTASRSPG